MLRKELCSPDARVRLLCIALPTTYFNVIIAETGALYNCINCLSPNYLYLEPLKASLERIEEEQRLNRLFLQNDVANETQQRLFQKMWGQRSVEPPLLGQCLLTGVSEIGSVGRCELHSYKEGLLLDVTQLMINLLNETGKTRLLASIER